MEAFQRVQDRLATDATGADVSVVIPCFRCASTIGRAVESVLRQTLLPREIIFVDDCSGDETLEVLKELANKYPSGFIRVMALPSNAGPATARNLGWDAALGRYIAFLDADDSWHPEKIEIQHSWMQQNTNVALTCHQWPLVSTTRAEHAIDGRRTFTPLSKWLLLLSNRVNTSTVMLRRELSLRFPDGRKYSEDYLLWLRLAFQSGGVARSNLRLAYRHKEAFGDTGLSGRLWEMEKGELQNYVELRRDRLIPSSVAAVAMTLSLLKFVRRLVVTMLRKCVA